MENDIIKRAWPDWEIEGDEEIGSSTFGKVYEVVHRYHGVTQRAAVKVISIPSDPSVLDALRDKYDTEAIKAIFKSRVGVFINEIDQMIKLENKQNIVSIKDFKVIDHADEIGSDIYIRMELLTPFNVHLVQKGFTEADVIKMGCDLCAALESCSKIGIIHRDIKPENILVSDEGDFKLGDFGVACNLESETAARSRGARVITWRPRCTTTGHTTPGRISIRWAWCSTG